jgi:hypothetical protein
LVPAVVVEVALREHLARIEEEVGAEDLVL